MPSPELQMFAAAAALAPIFLCFGVKQPWESAQILQLGEKAPKRFHRTGHFKNTLETNMLVCLIFISSYIASGCVSHWIYLMLSV